MISNGNALSNVQLTRDQLATLINLLSQQQKANPTSPHFDPNYFSQLMALQNPSTVSQPTTPTGSGQLGAASNWNLGRVVDDPSTITAQEVPMAGSTLFPSGDGEKIYCKSWGNDGLIEPRVYVRQEGTNPEPHCLESLEDPRIEEMGKRIADLEAAVIKLKKQSSKSAKAPSKSKAKPKPTPVEQVPIVEEEVIDGE